MVLAAKIRDSEELSEINGVEWKIEKRIVAYDKSLAFMQAKIQTIRDRGQADMVWMLEHPPVYTAGVSAKPSDLINPRFPIFETGRGGQYTYHGPGQRVAYLMLDLQKRGPDIKKYVYDLEEWIILALAKFDVKGERREGRVGIWVNMEPYGGAQGAESKIAAIGVRVRKWVSFHGLSINVNPDLNHYDGIVPCGLSQYGVTSLQDLGVEATMSDMDEALIETWDEVFK